MDPIGLRLQDDKASVTLEHSDRVMDDKRDKTSWIPSLQQVSRMTKHLSLWSTAIESRMTELKNAPIFRSVFYNIKKLLFQFLNFFIKLFYFGGFFLFVVLQPLNCSNRLVVYQIQHINAILHSFVFYIQGLFLFFQFDL